jgi:NADH pyrophosphatase NudC (nudix superfamily)
MDGIDPQTLNTIAFSTGIALMMVLSGLGKNMLEVKKKRRICPSCGHQIHGRVCNRHES